MKRGTPGGKWRKSMGGKEMKGVLGRTKGVCKVNKIVETGLKGVFARTKGVCKEYMGVEGQNRSVFARTKLVSKDNKGVFTQSKSSNDLRRA